MDNSHARSPSKEEFFADIEPGGRASVKPENHTSLNGAVPVKADPKPLFGQPFKDHIIKGFETSGTDPQTAHRHYDTIERETIFYVTNFIKDLACKAISKIKEGR